MTYTISIDLNKMRVIDTQKIWDRKQTLEEYQKTHFVNNEDWEAREKDIGFLKDFLESLRIYESAMQLVSDAADRYSRFFGNDIFDS